MLLSICIPTYNRAEYLENCINSIIYSSRKIETNLVEICISDNCSDDNTNKLIIEKQNIIPIKYYRSDINKGRVSNYINVVNMASGEFIWLLGDDDLLIEDALEHVCRLILEHKKIDFFYINSYHLDKEKLIINPDFIYKNNNYRSLIKFSNWNYSGNLKFIDLIDQKKSFDFLGGMFLAVFRRKNWISNINSLDLNMAFDNNEFSSIHNTFPHLIIYGAGFSKSNAYFEAEPQTINITGIREWAPLYPLVRSIRIQEALEFYKKNGLNIINYYLCMNSSLLYFVPDMFRLFFNRNKYPYLKIKFTRIFIKNSIYPNAYMSIFYSLCRLIMKSINLR